MNDNFTRHFLDLHRLSPATLREILDLAGTLKKAHAEGTPIFSLARRW